MFKYFKAFESRSDNWFGPSYNCLQFWCLMKLNHQRKYNILHCFALLFVVSQYIELYAIRNNFEHAMRNLSVTMLSTVCVFKAGTFIFWQKSWYDLFNFASELEMNQFYKNDPTMKSIINIYVQYSRKVTYLYILLVIATVLLVILAPLFSIFSFENQTVIKNGSYPEILSSWVPFDKTRGIGYVGTVIEHCLICFYGGGVVANFDCNFVVIMSFFAGQLNVLHSNCRRLFNDVITYDDAIEKIKECHYHHSCLVKYSAIFNSLLSPVMFLYVIICSLMICASAIQLTRDDTGNMQRIWIAEYLIAIIAQLFLYCWHSNEVLYTSYKASDGIYSSTWYTQNSRVRRSLLILGEQLHKSIEFTAGPFTKLNVASFVAILKGSYSFYTLLDKKDD